MLSINSGWGGKRHNDPISMGSTGMERGQRAKASSSSSSGPLADVKLWRRTGGLLAWGPAHLARTETSSEK